MPPSRPDAPHPAQAPAPRTPRRGSFAAGAVLLALLVLAGVAGAQLPDMPSLPTDPDVNLTAQTTTRMIEQGTCANYEVTVTNTGAPVEEIPISFLPPEEVTFELDMSEPVQGWRTGETPGSVELERGESATVSVSLCADDDAVQGEQVRMVLTAVLQPNSPADEEQTDSVPLSAQIEDEGLFGIPWDFPSWVLWVALAAVGVMLAAILTSRRSAAGSVVLECGESNKEVAPGRGTSFPVRLRNEGRSKDIVSLTTSPVPQGWDTFLPIVDVPLDAGDEQTVWISVKSPEDARGGDHVVVKVFARSSSTAGEQVSIDLTVTVRDSSSPGPGAWDRPDAPRSVYEPEDESGGQHARTVAVKRRKR